MARPTGDDISDRIQKRRQRVHVNIGPLCNNHCIFCMEDDIENRAAVNSAMTPERVRAILHSYAGAEEVCFTSGEPTLVRELSQYCGWAHDAGYERISIMTNGRRLANPQVLASLVAAGANLFYVSIHGHTGALHDGLTQVKGSFRQSLNGLIRLNRLKRFGIQVHTSTVLNRRNLDFVAEIYQFLRSRGVDQVVFNVMQPGGRAATNFKDLFVPYTEIAVSFEAALAAIPERPPQAFLVDIPLCVTERIPDFNRGFVEAHVHYEAELPVTGGGYKGAETNIEGLREIRRSDIDRQYREKREQCSTCVHTNVCEGVWRVYLDHFGWEEFAPVQKRSLE